MKEAITLYEVEPLNALIGATVVNVREIDVKRDGEPEETAFAITLINPVTKMEYELALPFELSYLVDMTPDK